VTLLSDKNAGWMGTFRQKQLFEPNIADQSLHCLFPMDFSEG
jgi:hypothetical protein